MVIDLSIPIFYKRPDRGPLELPKAMAPAQLTCRIRLHKAEKYDADTDQPEESAVFDLKDCQEVGIEVRTQWAREIMKYFDITHESVRPWDFLARLDGSVKLLPQSVSQGEVYPARFQIPLDTLRELDQPEKVRRAEKFAMASLLYEILSGMKPFEEMTDGEVQSRFSNAVFPEDAMSLPYSLYIHSGWSEEFSQEVNKRGMLSHQQQPRFTDCYSSSTRCHHSTSDHKLR